MLGWKEFSLAAPVIAKAGSRLLSLNEVAFLATVSATCQRRDREFILSSLVLSKKESWLSLWIRHQNSKTYRTVGGAQSIHCPVVKTRNFSQVVKQCIAILRPASEVQQPRRWVSLQALTSTTSCMNLCLIERYAHNGSISEHLIIDPSALIGICNEVCLWPILPNVEVYVCPASQSAKAL